MHSKISSSLTFLYMFQEFKLIIFLLPKFTFKIQEKGITPGKNPLGLKVASDKRHSMVMLCSYTHYTTCTSAASLSSSSTSYRKLRNDLLNEGSTVKVNILDSLCCSLSFSLSTSMGLLTSSLQTDVGLVAPSELHPVTSVDTAGTQDGTC